jgi:hypothetical protein
MLVAALKLFLAPGFIVAASLVARRFGVRTAGILAGLPVISGPILFVLALERGRDFTAGAAAGNVLGIVSLMAFVLAYVALTQAGGWGWALAGGWAAFGAATVALVPVHLGATSSFVAACAACALTLRIIPRHNRAARERAVPPRWDLPLRAACAAVPVLAVTAAATTLGPHTSGLLAAFPIITPVLTAFTHTQAGAQEAIRLLRGFTIGFFAYGLFCFTVAVALPRLGTSWSFALAAALALALQGNVVALASRREQGVLAGAVEG